MTDEKNIHDDNMTQDHIEPESRREFLVAVKRWSKAVVAGAVFGSILLRDDNAEAGAWANRRRGGRGAWGNGGGRAWGNGSRRAWGNGRGTWANRVGGGGWINR